MFFKIFLFDQLVVHLKFTTADFTMPQKFKNSIISCENRHTDGRTNRAHTTCDYILKHKLLM